MDMLVVGMHGKGNVAVSGCTDEEYLTHFAIWSFFGSPLMLGCDIRNMDEPTKKTILNKELIAINQDESYRQPFICGKYWNVEDILILAKFLEGGDVAIGMFNINDASANPYFSFDSIGLSRISGKSLLFRDVIKQEDVGVYSDVFQSDVIAPHGCRVYRCKLVDAK